MPVTWQVLHDCAQAFVSVERETLVSVTSGILYIYIHTHTWYKDYDILLNFYNYKLNYNNLKKTFYYYKGKRNNNLYRYSCVS